MDEIYKSAEILQVLLFPNLKDFTFKDGGFAYQLESTYDIPDTTILFDGKIVLSAQGEYDVDVYPNIFGIRRSFSISFHTIKQELENLTFDPVYDKLSDFGKRIKLPSIFENKSGGRYNTHKFTLEELHSFILLVKKKMENS